MEKGRKARWLCRANGSVKGSGYGKIIKGFEGDGKGLGFYSEMGSKQGSALVHFHCYKKIPGAEHLVKKMKKFSLQL